MKKTFLLLGGAGYIGSHTAYELIKRDYQVIIVDNLSTGNKKAIHSKAIFFCGNYDDYNLLNQIFLKYKIEAIFIFAASILVNESIHNPFKYYDNNVVRLINLLKIVSESKIKKIVFSSSAAVYGQCPESLIKETAAKNPINPYGHTKLMGEFLIQGLAQAYNIHYAFLRYFNVAGADLENKIGLLISHDKKPVHLIPTIAYSLIKKEPKLIINGNDYPTNDGTNIRDYIHVTDLACAHVLAALALEKNSSLVFNVGSNKGYSNLEIIYGFEKFLNEKINFEFGPKRIGDPARLVADSTKIKDMLNFEPQFSIHDIIKSEFNWIKKQLMENS